MNTLVERRMQIAGAAVPAVKAEATAEGIPMNDGGAYRLAYAAVADAVQRQEWAVERLRELRALLGEGAGFPGIGPGGIRVVLGDVIDRLEGGGR
jgi:hypothetical protein